MSLLKKGDHISNDLVIERLAQMGLNGGEVRLLTPYLLDTLEDDGYYEPLEYLRSTMLLLRLLPSPTETMPRLVRLLAKDKEPNSFPCAAYAVSKFARQAVDAKRYVPELIQALRHDGASSKHAFMLVDKAPDIQFGSFEDLRSIVVIVEEGPRLIHDRIVRIESLRRAARQTAGPGPSEAEVDDAACMAYEIESRHEDHLSATECIDDALVQIGTPATAGLLGLLDDQNLAERTASILSRIRPTCPEVVRHLIARLDNDDSNISLAAARAMENICGPDALRAVDSLRRIMKRKEIGPFYSVPIARVLAKVGDPRSGIGHLRSVIISDARSDGIPPCGNGQAAVEAFHSLLELGPEGIGCVNALAKHEDWRVRFLAQTAMRRAKACDLNLLQPRSPSVARAAIGK